MHTRNDHEARSSYSITTLFFLRFLSYFLCSGMSDYDIRDLKFQPDCRSDEVSSNRKESEKSFNIFLMCLERMCPAVTNYNVTARPDTHTGESYEYQRPPERHPEVIPLQRRVGFLSRYASLLCVICSR